MTNKGQDITGNVIDLAVLKRVLGLSKPHRLLFYSALVLAIFLAFLGPMRAYLVQDAIDNYILPKNQEGLLTMFLLLIGVLVTEAVFRFAFTYSSKVLGQSVVKDLRDRVFGHVMRLRLTYFDTTPIGTSTTRTVNDTETISDIFANGILLIFADILMLIVIIVSMLVFCWPLALASMISLPFLLYATYIFKEKVKVTFQDVRNQVARLNAFLQERISGMRVIQVFGAEAQEFSKFDSINAAHRKANIRAIWYYSIFFPTVEILLSIAIGLMVWTGTSSILDGNLYVNHITWDHGIQVVKQPGGVGTVVTYILLINMLFRPIRFLADRFNVLQMGLVASNRVFDLLDKDFFIEDEGQSEQALKGKVVFDKVHFSYVPEEPVLKGISFTVEPGETLAIVGSTGSGKTTIINVLGRFYELDSGSITVDDEPLETYSLKHLRRQMAVVLQDVFLFSGSIEDNVRLSSSISREQIIRAAKIVGAHEYIERLPGGYDFQVGERGNMLSMGQKQLISFVRALVQDPALLILDEATSSIDTETERIIQHAVENLIKNQTSIVIAHRLSTIQNADKIMVLHHGVIQEFGTWDELVAQNGRFAAMVKAQS